MMDKRKMIRFAITMKGNCLEHWKLDCIKLLMTMPEVKLAMIVETPEKPVVRKQSPLYKMYHSFVRLRSKLFKRVPPPDNFGKVPKIHCTNFADLETPYSKEDVEFIKGMDLDFILHLDETGIDGELLNVTRYGVWTFRYGQSERCPKVPGGWREIRNNEPVTEVGLYRLTGNPQEWIPLRKGYFATVFHSFRKNKEMLCQSILNWPALVCKEIFDYPSQHKEKSIQVIPTTISENEYLTSTVETVKFIAATWKHKAWKLYRKLFCYEFWNVGIVHKPIHSFLNDKHPIIDWLVPENNCYFADPFGLKDEDGIHILMEEVDHKVVKGYISGVSMKGEVRGRVAQDWSRSVMKLESHMSYPYLLEYGGEVYCIPETSEAREVAVYKKVNGKWVKFKTILKEFAAVDSTIIHHGDYWWLFCTKAGSSPQSDNSELHIYFAKELFGDWNPHLSNPVKVDIRSSRPAGTPFLHDKQIIRPAQDCSKTYGGRIVLNKVTALTIDKFEEVTVSPVEPRDDSMYPDGVHTISSVGDITVLDGKRFDYSMFHLFKKLYKYKPMKEVS
ncbi:hypothetical protein AB685_06560 [Bacillus sp. LL01]|uniref:glucosamine inositolphosphorylceramide transferase family protein n=1 Tax=Bacillus sp. LL01 TaxID=1665556 RepID=UPI00064D3A90|nr:hypothetical protein [Bacillus sp. LL01]KMJ58742.1 hypothetical protein AB685_06560 [Bacillus sp. LL01]